MTDGPSTTEIPVLSALHAVRARPAMYFGVDARDDSLPGRALAMVVGDAVGERPMGTLLRVAVTIESDLVFSVRDDGPGLPVHGRPAVDALLSRLFAGRGRGPRGVGLAMVTAVSSAVTADVWRDGRHYRQWADWRHELPPIQDLGPSDEQGTSLRFHLDPTYVGPDAALPAHPAAFVANVLGEGWRAPSYVDLAFDDARG